MTLSLSDYAAISGRGLTEDGPVYPAANAGQRVQKALNRAPIGG